MTRPDAEALHELTDIIVASSRRSLDWFRTPLAVDNKLAGADDGGELSRFDPVTEADRFVEDLLRAEISQRFPEHSILGEERGITGGGGKGGPSLQWIIDPIDGTRAFVSGQPSWGTLVGLVDDGVPVAGWMHLPVLDETYVAINGKGSHRGPRSDGSLVSRASTPLDEAILLTTHPSMFVTPAEIGAFGRVAEQVRLTRYGGDCLNYGLVAAGFADVVIENQLQPYDIIPLIPIVEAAGGRVTDLEGNIPLGGGFVVASANASLHVAILDLLSS